ncbi:MAG: hypothetical protein LBI94_03325 [Treponema sp.]|jgi:hypothetical protein|nr:hypothetical protein [Treponema sp.]
MRFSGNFPAPMERCGSSLVWPPGTGQELGPVRIPAVVMGSMIDRPAGIAYIFLKGILKVFSSKRRTGLENIFLSNTFYYYPFSISLESGPAG